MENCCDDADRWNPMYSEKTYPSVMLSTTNPNGLSSREILRCETNGLRKGTTQHCTTINIKYVSMNVKYGFQSDDWYALYTVISNFLRTVVPTLLQGLRPAVRHRLCSNKMELKHCMGNKPHSGRTRHFYCI
jgi:hypothetical protein